METILSQGYTALKVAFIFPKITVLSLRLYPRLWALLVFAFLS